MRVTEFKSYYDSLIIEAQQLQDTVNNLSNINSTLSEEVSVLTQQLSQVEIQLNALHSQQTQQCPADVVKSERLSDSAVFDESSDKLKGFLLKLQIKMMMNAD